MTVKNGERQSARTEHLLVVVAQVEPRAEHALGLGPEPLKLQEAGAVGEGLAR